MSRIKTAGPLPMRLRSLSSLIGIGIATTVRHIIGRKMAPDWDIRFETGIRFWRHQFTRAMTQQDMARGRLILDSVQTETADIYDVSVTPQSAPRGDWYRPNATRSAPVALYLHGGGYTFHGAMSRRFAAMLAHHLGMALFAPDYRLTPEHQHPAQAEDALAAWRYVTAQVPPERLIVIGDSAGGHMALTLLQTLRTWELAQPALCIGLSPWVDVGPRGKSLSRNDRYDLVQGWMALRFGDWLDQDDRHGRAALSPFAQDFQGLAPIYLQAGGREVLRDMIMDFAERQAAQGASIMLDLWPDMPHDFQAFDSETQSSNEALSRLRLAVDHSARGERLPLCARTATSHGF